MIISPSEDEQIARLLSFLLAGERLAHDCAAAQAVMVSDPGARRFLRTQARQEFIHSKIFEHAIAWLAPRGVRLNLAKKPLVRYRRLIETAMVQGDIAETLIAQQVILEGLGEVVLHRISTGMTARGMDFASLRRAILNQERSHHAFGLRWLETLAADDEPRLHRLRERAHEYLGLAGEMLDDLTDLFEHFDENPAAYLEELWLHLPARLTDMPDCRSI